MIPELRVVAGEKRQRFFHLIRQTHRLPLHELVRVVGAKLMYSPRLRAAALRNLVASTPTAITLGRCYAERRRLVRRHFGV